MSGIITWEGKQYKVTKTTLSIYIKTEEFDDDSKKWVYGLDHIWPQYGLEFEVEESSGEDDELMPILNAIPAYLAFNEKHPTLEDLAGAKIAVPDDDWYWDAWFGNDADPLYNNELIFSQWQGNSIGLTWKNDHFVYEGQVEFIGLSVRVKQEGDEDIFISALYGDSLKNWEKKKEPWHDTALLYPELAKEYDQDRLRWLPVKYMPQAPLNTA